jgi:predicted NAD/FAD-dependent oxidoreductase
VRPRPIHEQARRFDVAEYERRVHRPSRGTPLTVAVIGAGVAGAAAARALRDAGHVVTLFDKGRGPGGRVSTRREGELSFDHGAPCFRVHDERFARWARSWWQERVLAEWKPKLEVLGPPRGEDPEAGRARLVATPGMSALVGRLLVDLDVRFGVEVKGLTRDGARWRLLDAAGHALGEYDAAVVATPAPQAATLVDPSSYALGSRLREVAMAPCWALLVHLDEALGVEWDAAECTVGPLQWLARNSSKPGRPELHGESWVLHASTEWSRAHLEATPDEVAAMLLDAFFATTGARRVEPSSVRAHRWRYARATKPLGEPCAWEPELQLAVCGDWCLGDTVEAAFLSGSAAAGRLNAVPALASEHEPERPLAARAQLTLGLH